jgi:hypothetical protein
MPSEATSTAFFTKNATAHAKSGVDRAWEVYFAGEKDRHEHATTGFHRQPSYGKNDPLSPMFQGNNGVSNG